MATRSTRAPRRSTELLGVIVSCVGALALLFGLLPSLIQGPIGLMLLGFALLAAISHVAVTIRAGLSAARAVFEVLIVTSITFALVYGVVWYFTVYLASQPDFLRLSPPSTP